jgi:hypothetical protein
VSQKERVKECDQGEQDPRQQCSQQSLPVGPLHCPSVSVIGLAEIFVRALKVRLRDDWWVRRLDHGESLDSCVSSPSK